MWLPCLSRGFQSHPPLSTSKLGPSGADSWWVDSVRSRPLWVPPMDSPVRLGVSPASASTPTGVFNQRFEALFPLAGALGSVVFFAPPPFLLVYLCANVGPQGLPATTLWGLLAVAWPAPFHNPLPRWVHQPLPCCEVLSAPAASLCPSYRSG